MSGIMTFYWASLKNDSRVVARSYQVGDEWGGGWMVEEGEVDYGSTDLFSMLYRFSIAYVRWVHTKSELAEQIQNLEKKYGELREEEMEIFP